MTHLSSGTLPQIEGKRVQTFAFLIEIMSLRSFISVWFWVVVAIFWTSVCNQVLGVAYDMIAAAKRGDGKMAQDVAVIATIGARQSLAVADPLSLFVAYFAVASCLTAGFLLGSEIFAASSFIALPWLILGGLRRKTALYVLEHSDRVDLVLARLIKHRKITHYWAILFIFLTALYGLGHAFTYSVLN